jgi:N-acetylmuramoyl-L-alanine amidase
VTRNPFLIIGIVLGLAATSGCAGPKPTKITELDPYVGHYPSATKPPTPGKPVVAKAEPAAKQPARTLKGATILVDAGHGAHDPGTKGVSSTAEKDINLAIALKLVKALQSRGAKVITVRNNDHFVDKYDRAAMADKTHADLFVSIHSDSSKKPDVSGATVYISRQASAQSTHAGQAIAAALGHAGIECRGVHTAGYVVLVHHSRPAVLVECGFLSNRGDAQRLNSAAYQSKLAEAIAEGIAQHFSG